MRSEQSGMVQKRPGRRGTRILFAAVISVGAKCVGLGALSFAFTGLPLPWKTGNLRRISLAKAASLDLFADIGVGRNKNSRPITAADLFSEPEETESVGLVTRIDVRREPWDVLREIHQREAQRCWAPRSDGKVRGFIADVLPFNQTEEAESTAFEIAKFRRRWKSRAKTPEEMEDESDVLDPYQVLNLSPDATEKDIKKAYLWWASRLHPDKGGDPEKFQDVLLAYRILKDSCRREFYDKTGKDTGDEKVEEVQYVKLPDLEILKEGIDKHEELKWEDGYEKLAGKVGTVQADILDRGVTQVLFNVGDGEAVAAWFPNELLRVVSGDGGNESAESYDCFQGSGLILRTKNEALMKKQAWSRKEATALAMYSGGFQAVEGNKPTAKRDAAFALSFFQLGGRDTKKGSLLDLGCGSGSASHLFAKKNKFGIVIGLDNDRKALLEARQGAEDERIGPEQGFYLIRGDAQDLPFREQQIDNVWWGFGWHECGNPVDVLKGVFHVMAPGGRIAISTQSGLGLAQEIQNTLKLIGFNETRIYPPRHKVFLNYASKPR